MATSREELINTLWYDKHFASLTSNRTRLEHAVAKYLPLERLQEMVKKDIDDAKVKNSKSLTRAKQFKKEADFLAKTAVGEGGLDKALICYHKAILDTPKTEPHLLAKLYIRKSALHVKEDQHEAGLYAIITAIKVLETRTSQPPKVEYLVLRVTALKNCKYYGEAYQSLEQLLQQLPSSPQKHGNTSVVNIDELRSMLQTLKQLILEQDIHQMVRVCSITANALPETSNLSQPYAAYKLSENCKIENSPVVGRHFIAAADILGNEVLLKERPYSTVLSIEHVKKRCSYCFSKLGFKFYPCSDCTEVVFCDEKCSKLAFETSHRFECGLRSAIFAIGNLSTLHVSQMVAFVGGPIRAFDAQQWGKQVNFSIENFLADPAQLSRPHLEKTTEEKWRAYTMASNLVAHDEAHKFNENVWQTIAGLEMAALFDHIYRFRMERPSLDFFLDLAAMLIVDIRRIAFNVFGWQSWNSDDSNADLEHLAQAQCLVGSLINHSCVPNCSWEFSDEGVIQFVAKRPIKAGDEITISYGAYSTQSYDQRQKRLNNYYFACACPACFQDARKGTALRCLFCTGPVPYEQIVNKVPQLSGKCLLCFKFYPNAAAAIEKLKAARLALKMLKSMSSVVAVNTSAGGRYQCGHLMLAKAAELVRTLEKLSFLDSDQVQRTLLCCSAVFENLGVRKFSATFPLEEQIELELLIVRHLKLSKLQKNISTLQFWFERLLELVAAFNDNSTQYNAYETNLWTAVFSLYEKLKGAIEGVSKSRSRTCSSSVASTLAKLKQERLAAISQSLQRAIIAYGPDRVISLREALAATSFA